MRRRRGGLKGRLARRQLVQAGDVEEDEGGVDGHLALAEADLRALVRELAHEHRRDEAQQVARRRRPAVVHLRHFERRLHKLLRDAFLSLSLLPFKA